MQTKQTRGKSSEKKEQKTRAKVRNMDTLQPFTVNAKTNTQTHQRTMDTSFNNENVTRCVTHRLKYNLFILCFVSSIGAIMYNSVATVDAQLFP